MEQILVGPKAIADMIGVSDRHIRRLITEGNIEKIKNGQYDIVDCSRGKQEFLYMI